MRLWICSCDSCGNHWDRKSCSDCARHAECRQWNWNVALTLLPLVLRRCRTDTLKTNRIETIAHRVSYVDVVVRRCSEQIFHFNEILYVLSTFRRNTRKIWQWWWLLCNNKIDYGQRRREAGTSIAIKSANATYDMTQSEIQFRMSTHASIHVHLNT